MVERIKKIIEKLHGTPSLFADTIGISRASMNHILNGRNNPSLDVITKILGKYPDINTEWLMFGTGPMYKGEKAFLQPSLFDEVPVIPDKQPDKPEFYKETEVKLPEKLIKSTEIEEVVIKKDTTRIIDRIIIYYSDHTFENFVPENKQ